MNLIIKKDNQTFGPHTTEEISEFIKNGDLVLSDLASPEGEENWEPLETLLSDSETEKEDPSFYDQFEDDDVDYDKLKEWEDVFVDEDNDTNEDEFSAQTNESVPENSPSAVSTPPPLIVPESASDQVESFTTPPPLVNPSPISVPPPESSFPATNEQVTENIESIPSSLPPPPSEPPPQKESTAKEKKVSKESSGRREPRDRISNSRKIKGLNSKQTVIVVKGEGIISKIYSTSLVFIILMVVVSLVVLAGLIFAPDRVVPILTNIGVPSELIETIVPPGTGK